MSFSELVNAQDSIFQEIQTIFANFKKDGPGRKTTIPYHDERIERLESCWAQFKSNDAKMSTFEGDRVGPYYEKNIFIQVKNLYEEAKRLIQQSKLTLTESKSTENGSDTYDERTQEMLSEQRSNIRAFERAIQNLGACSIKERWQLEDKLRTLNQRWEKVDSMYWKLDNVIKNMAPFERDYIRLEIMYEENKERLNRKMWDQQHQQKSTPTLELPIFNGNYAQWTTFKDLFVEIVDLNPYISKAQKMQHLKSKLRGEPEKLVQHLNISSDNYEACWAILQQRYDNIRLLFTYHANTLLNQPTIQNPSASQLKRMHDVTVECMHAIANLNIDTEGWDPLTVHILLQKLDSETNQTFIESLENSRKLPTLDELLHYIEKKFMAIESSANSSASSSRNKNPMEQIKQSKMSYNTFNNKAKLPQRHTSYMQKEFPKAPNHFQTLQHSKSYHNTSTFVSRGPKCKNNHALYNCREFLSLTPEERLRTTDSLNICRNCLFSHNGQACISNNKCKQCGDVHNTILHDAFAMKNAGKISKPGHRFSTHVAHANSNELLIPTAIIKVMSKDGTFLILRALLDQASHATLITENAAQRLQVKRNRLSAEWVSGVGRSPATRCKGLVDLNCQSMHNDYTFHVQANIMNEITSNLPNMTIDKQHFEHLNNLQLADPAFYVSQHIDILLGVEYYAELLLGGLIKKNSSPLIAQETQLGWIVSGKEKRTLNCHVIVNNLEDIARFWENESVEGNCTEIDPNNKCEQFYSETTTRLPDGKYQVRLPLKDNIEQDLGKSKPQAIAQFLQLERKMARIASYAEKYREFMKEYEDMGHMAVVRKNNGTLEYFSPHHGVVRPGAVTTKHRTVFNFSGKSSSGYSLNDLMETGPNLQKDLFGILLQWRKHKYVLTADIEKMYRFIAMHPDHQPLQKIIWRETPQQLLKEYCLTTVAYGTKAAPFLAMRTLKQLAFDEGDNYPLAKIVLLNNFFMDDAMFGFDSMEDARKARDQLIQLLRKGCFNLRKWASNETQLVSDLPENIRNPQNFEFTETQTSKALGLAWNPKNDEFIFSTTLQVQHSNKKQATKRQILSEISTIFDPLGCLSPVTVKAKLLFQRVWKYNLSWDDVVPDEIQKEWVILRNELTNMEPFKVKRWLGFNANIDCDLHAFCDASEKAYSCVVYSTVREETGNIQVTLLAAKTKVAPVQKQQTLPRLELCGAHLLAQLVEKIKIFINKPNIKVTAWTDSMVVLGWLNGDVTRWKSYVANRIKEILPVLPADNWRHVRSEQNPADCASRGLLPSQLHNFSLWWEGPEWLRTGDIPENNKTLKHTTPEMELKVHTITSSRRNGSLITDIINRNSSITKTILVIAWILRFIAALGTKRHNYKRRRHTHDASSCDVGPRQTGYLTLAEMQNATNVIISNVQRQHFEHEINDLKTKGKVNNKSPILKLNPYLGQDQLLHVGGRLGNSYLSEKAKHPIIIPKDTHLAQLLIDQAHKTILHGGARLTLATLRQQYWIIGGTATVKRELQKCVKCCRFKTTKPSQLMADLPRERIQQSPPFFHTGIDYTGCVDIKLNKGRGIKTSKGYIAVFVCMVTKAVHLELVSDLSTPTFLLALKRMAARRGCPKHMYSDNGTNFVGAERELNKQFNIEQTFNNNTLSRNLNELGIEWHFNAPSWPTAGGLWESSVKSMKYHLKRVLGEQKLTYEEFMTLLTQIEACMNSRPLCPLSEDVEDLDYLTPGHFLVGRPLVAPPHENIQDKIIGLRNRWQLLEKMLQGFWRKWTVEYLQQLQVRSKWNKQTENLKLGDIVLIKEDNLPPTKWALGRVQEVHPGKDKLVRVVTLKTKGGSLTRPITKLAKLPTETNEKEKPEVPKTPKQPLPNNNKNAQQRKRMPRLGKLNCNFVCLLVTLATLFHPTTQTNTEQQTYNFLNITQFEQNRALYFDRIGNLQTVHNDWKIVTYYNMTTYWQAIDNIQRVVKHLTSRCDEFEYQTMCRAILTELNLELSELDHNNYLLKTHHGQIKGRVTRGLINGVGYLANSLFGVLDENFAKQYKQDIEEVHKNREHLLDLIKEQTSVIEAHNNILKRNEQTMNTQFNLISKHLNITDNYLQGLEVKLREAENMNYFNIMTTAATIILSKLRHIQHMLLNTAVNIHHGHVDTQLLPQNQLLQELNTISGHIPKYELSLPVDDIQTQLADIYKLLEVKSRIIDNFFIIEITLPLTSNAHFALYRTIPVPILDKFNKTLTMIIDSKYIAVNTKRELYMTLSDNDITPCIKIEPATYICSINKPTRNMRSLQRPCEISAITNSTSLNCTYLANSYKDNWIPLEAPNTWLYVCHNDCQLQVVCKELHKSQLLRHTGIISVHPGCMIRNGEDTFYTQMYYHNNVYINPEIPTLTFGNINEFILVTKMDPSNMQIQTEVNADEYNSLQSKIKHIEQQDSYGFISNDIHQFAVSYTTLGLVLIVVAAGSMYMLWKRRRANSPNAKNEETPQTPQATSSTKHPRPGNTQNRIYATPHQFNITT